MMFHNTHQVLGMRTGIDNANASKDPLDEAKLHLQLGRHSKPHHL